MQLEYRQSLSISSTCTTEQLVQIAHTALSQSCLPPRPPNTQTHTHAHRSCQKPNSFSMSLVRMSKRQIYLHIKPSVFWSSWNRPSFNNAAKWKMHVPSYIQCPCVIVQSVCIFNQICWLANPTHHIKPNFSTHLQRMRLRSNLFI